jgi:general secretion pathway protein D
MQIFQEVSSVDQTQASTSGLITNKRSIESNVLVENGGVVVLGGLIEDKYGGNAQKVPGVGDVPGLGALFRSEARNRSKTNLMVFLRPVVLKDAAQAEGLSLDRYDLMRGYQREVQPRATPLLPLGGAAQLPEIARPPAVITPAPAAPAVQTAPVR